MVRENLLGLAPVMGGGYFALKPIKNFRASLHKIVRFLSGSLLKVMKLGENYIGANERKSQT
jgi:hypothetical protein